jgi:hypothetical protein
MTEYRIIIPDDNYTLIKGEDENQLVTILVNTGLAEFEQRVVFPWYLSVLFFLPERESGRPTNEESELVNNYEDFLIKGLRESAEKPNALHLAARTGNSMKCIKFLVHDPEIADNFLKSVCDRNDTPFPLEYKMDHDPEWIEANGFFELAKISS